MKIRPVILCGGAGTRLWQQSKNNNWADEALVEKYILQNDFQYVCEDHYECPGGHLWHVSHIIDEINDMTIDQINELSKYGE